tara:strand:- start:201 stop:860 length:660 start_codon:yes stop_codon:yes gene_type:complete
MEYIYNSPVVKIQKNNTHSFTIHSSSNNYFKKSLEVLNIHSENDDVSTKINIQLESFVSLRNYIDNKPDKLLEIFDVTFMIQDIVNQIQHLENNNKTIPFFSIDDFFILNKNSCLFVGLDKVCDYNTSGNFKIQEILKKKKDSFFSPEINAIKQIPTTIHYKSCYYSLGIMLLKIFIDIDIKNIDDFYEKAKIIHGLPCYWFIRNAISKNSKDRYILFI